MFLALASITPPNTDMQSKLGHFIAAFPEVSSTQVTISVVDSYLI
jgi:hypothetical protein